MTPGGEVTVPLDSLSGPVVSSRKSPFVSGHFQIPAVLRIIISESNDTGLFQLLRVDPSHHGKVAVTDIHGIAARDHQRAVITGERHSLAEG